MNKFILLIRRILIAFLFITCSENNTAGGVDETHTGVAIEGKVITSGGKGVANILAKISGTPYGERTDSEGYYEIVVSPDSMNNSTINFDSLSKVVEIVKDSTVIKRLAFNNWVDSLPDTYLIQRSISGKLVGDESQIKRVEAVISKVNDSLNEPKVYTLWLNVLTSMYNGFVYFESDTTEAEYEVFVRVYTGNNSSTGYSQTLPFISSAGNLGLPEFNIYNSIPTVKIIGVEYISKNAYGKSVVFIGDTVSIHVKGYDRFGGVIGYLWSYDNSDWYFETDTIIRATWGTEGSKFVFVKSKDYDNITSKVESIDVTVEEYSKSILPQLVELPDTLCSGRDSCVRQLQAFDSLGEIVQYYIDRNEDGIWDDSSSTGRFDFTFHEGGVHKIYWIGMNDRSLESFKSSFGVDFETAPMYLSDTVGTMYDSRTDKPYGWVKINDQIWMSDNMPSQYIEGVIVDSSERNTCPSRWHLPSTLEWKKLHDYVVKADDGEKERILTSFESTDGWAAVERCEGLYNYNRNNAGLFGFRDMEQWENEKSMGWVGTDTSGFFLSFMNDPYDAKGHNWIGKARHVKCILNDDKFDHTQCLDEMYFNENICTTMERCGSFIDDRDRREYPWIKLGNQTWMNSPLLFNNDTIGDCIYQHSACEDEHNWHGVLYYSIGEVLSGEYSDLAPSGIQGICPEGWHIPSEEEWLMVGRYLKDNMGVSYSNNEDVLKNINEYGNRFSGWNVDIQAFFKMLNSYYGASPVEEYLGPFTFTYWMISDSDKNAVQVDSRPGDSKYHGILDTSYGVEYLYPILCVQDED